MAFVWLILDIKPLGLPTLDKTSDFEVQVINIGSNRKNGTTNIVDNGVSGVTTNIEEMLPKAPMGMNSKETLAKSDETSNVENGIRRELIQLYAINKQKATKKLVVRKRKTAEEERKEHYPPARLRDESSFISEELEGALRQKAGVPCLAELPRHALGRSPPDDPFFGGLHSGSGSPSNLVFAHGGKKGKEGHEN